MDRKEIVEQLRKHAAEFDGGSLLVPASYAKLYNAAADLLAADGWVKVSERLPAMREDVLVYTAEDCFLLAYLFPDVGWISTDGGDDLDDVTHWRPLPPEPGHD